MGDMAGVKDVDHVVTSSSRVTQTVSVGMPTVKDFCSLAFV